jgi:hypothetical protein
LPTTTDAVLGSAAQAATSGFADEILGTMIHLSGGYGVPAWKNLSAAEATDMLRQRIAGGRLAHPVAALAGTLGGGYVNPLNKLLGPLTAGLRPVSAGAVTGVGLGAAQGFGEGTGSPGQRLPSAAVGAVVGGATGALIGKFLPTTQKIWKNVLGIFGKKVPIARAQVVAEDAMRKTLAAENLAPEQIERIITTWRATAGPKGTALPPPPAPAAPVVVRPGETLTQTSPRGFEVTGTRPTPPVPTAPTVAEMLGVTTRDAPIGGQTMPQVNQQESARNAFNYLQGLGAGPEAATAGARNVAGHVANASNIDPRQALLLALLLGHKR